MRIRTTKSKHVCQKCNYTILGIGNYNKHILKCDGSGPKRIRLKLRSKRCSKEWKEKISNGLKLKYKNEPEWKESQRQIVINLIKNNIITGNPKNPEDMEKKRERARKNILNRYANGLEVKCGRAKKIDYESPIAGEIKVDGNWELKVAQYLDSLEVIWRRNKKRFNYININNKNSTYCPDFFVEDWNTYIEVKGYETDLDRCKWSQFNEPLQIWKKEKLKELKIL